MFVTEIQAPTRFTYDDRDRDVVRLFLGGSIEMGKAREWQKEVIAELKKWDGTNPFKPSEKLDTNTYILIYNPRRDDWDSTWDTSANNPKFNEQVTWEMDHQENSDICVYYFAENTLSPITLLELGSYSKRKTCAIGADRDYLRLGNLEMFCRYHKLDYAITFDNFLNLLKETIYKQVTQSYEW